MKTHEMLELAAADAMGLLDAEEREAFERAFRAAAPAVQAQIRREQTRLAALDGVLPEVEPPLGLRARVLAAVQTAMQSVAGRHAGVAGTIMPEIVRPRGVNPIWRAAAIGAAAAAAVLGAATVQLRNDYELIQQQYASGAHSEAWLREFGAKFERRLLDPNTRLVQFSCETDRPSGTEGTSKGALLLDTKTKQAQLFLKNLPAAEDSYALVVTDDAGRVMRAVLTFRGSGPALFQREIAALELEGAAGLAIVPSREADGQTILAPVLRSSKL